MKPARRKAGPAAPWRRGQGRVRPHRDVWTSDQCTQVWAFSRVGSHEPPGRLPLPPTRDLQAVGWLALSDGHALQGRAQIGGKVGSPFAALAGPGQVEREPGAVQELTLQSGHGPAAVLAI